MGKTLDAILGRTFKTSKFKPVASLAISRLAVFKHQRQVRYNQSRSDVVQLLEQGHHDRALLRVEHVIKEQNMLDVFVMMEGYCNVVVERLHLIEQDRECPDELKEAISSLLFASSRCGDFPELQEIRAAFTAWYGKEFAARAIELRNNCGVNTKMIQKLSTRLPDLESRMRVLKEIASENNIVLQLEEPDTITTEEKLDKSNMQDQLEPETSTTLTRTKPVENLQISPEDFGEDGLSDSTKARRKYKDVADAAQAAFESAAYAAAAARAAVELSRSSPHDPDNHNSPRNGRGKVSGKDEAMKTEPEVANQKINDANAATHMRDKSVVEMKKSVSISRSESAEADLKVTTMPSDGEEDKSVVEMKSVSISRSESAEADLKVTTMRSDGEEDHAKQLEKDIAFDKSNTDTHDLDETVKPNKLKDEVLATEKSNRTIPSIIQAGLNLVSRHKQSTAHAAEGSGKQSSQKLKTKKGPFSVQTRQVRGY